MTLPNIAFIGKAGAGKTTCAEILVKQYGYERLSFAAPLKVACATTTDRTLLQTVGAGARDLYEDFWVNLALDEMHRRQWPHDGSPIASLPKRFVVDDCRYPNEAYALKAEGFVIVRVVAPTTTRVNRLQANGKLQNVEQLEHTSETALDDYRADHRIVNDGWPDDLEADLRLVFERAVRAS